MTVTVHEESLVADLRAALAGDVIDRADTATTRPGRCGTA